MKNFLSSIFNVSAATEVIKWGLSFAFGIAVGGLLDYHLFHNIAQMHEVVKKTSWITDAFQAETWFGGSVVDGMLWLADLFGEDAPILDSEQTLEVISRSAPQNVKPAF